MPLKIVPRATFGTPAVGCRPLIYELGRSRKAETTINDTAPNLIVIIPAYMKLARILKVVIQRMNCEICESEFTSDNERQRW